MTERLVFLVPGFFGFTSVRSVSYFEDVEQTLARALRRRGVEARIVRCATQPTASIVRRADALRRQVERSGGRDARELHFVGHSTGGLDVGMLLTPGVRIARGGAADRIARTTKTAISVATPHFGAPLANHFLTVQRQPLLLLLSALARGLSFAATPATNDGIVPTLSQVHGRVLHVARADHLDVVGHFTLASGRTGDWFPSGAGFTPAEFEATWEAVAKAIAGSRRRAG